MVSGAVMKRTFDILAALIALIVFAIPMLAIAVAVRLTSEGPVLYWSQRVGRLNQVYWMPKFRTMRIETPVVATHLLSDPALHLTPIGGFLRKSSLDELPQFWSVLRGGRIFVNERDELEIPLKVVSDAACLLKRTLWFDLRVLALAGARVLGARGVAHCTGVH